MNSYQPGTHIIATLTTNNEDRLLRFAGCKKLIDDLILQYSLRNLGEVYHNFSPAGFTGVVCLSESHISIHTWPEHGIINLDIYLSNFERNNDGTVSAILDACVAYFDGNIDKLQTIYR